MHILLIALIILFLIPNDWLIYGGTIIGRGLLIIMLIIMSPIFLIAFLNRLDHMTLSELKAVPKQSKEFFKTLWD